MVEASWPNEITHCFWNRINDFDHCNDGTSVHAGGGGVMVLGSNPVWISECVCHELYDKDVKRLLLKEKVSKHWSANV